MREYAAIFDAGRIPASVRELVRRVIRDMVDGRSDLEAVRHPLGFLCLPIERQGKCGICVHIWSAEFDAVETTTSDIHAHSWDLISFILAGELHNVRGEICPDQSNYRIYEVHSGDRGDELRATSRLVGYRTVGRDVNSRGDTYRMQAGCFHRTVASEATTIAIGRDRPGKVDLSLGAVDGRSHVVRRQRCDRTTSARAARLVAAQLAMNRKPMTWT